MSEEQRLSDAPGRPVDVVSGAPAALWQAHPARVASYVQQHGGQPVTHEHMDQALDLSRRLARHDLEAERRRGLRTLGVVVAYTAALLTALLVGSRFDSTALLVLVAGGAAAAAALPGLLTRHVRYGRGNRPRFAGHDG